MWDRKVIKANARASFAANYWRCVLIPVILIGIGMVFGLVMGLSSAMSMLGDMDGLENAVNSLNDGNVGQYLSYLMPKLRGIYGVTGLISLFLINPLSVGTSRFFLVNSYTPAEVNEIVYGFKGGRYLKSVLTMFLVGILTTLASLLFLIPGIILTYSFRLVPYILADDPDVSAIDALTRSRELMKGNKWKSFVLDLSFIGWIILSAFTMHILMIFWVLPYMLGAQAEMYRAIVEIHNTGNYSGGKGGSGGYAPDFGAPYGQQDAYGRQDPYAQQNYGQPAYAQPDVNAQPTYAQPDVNAQQSYVQQDPYAQQPNQAEAGSAQDPYAERDNARQTHQPDAVIDNAEDGNI